MKPKFDRAIVYGTVDCIFGVILIIIQAIVTYYCDNFIRPFDPRLRPKESLLDMGLASLGIWIGFIFLITGCLGILSGLKRRSPTVGVNPARDSYSKFTYGFFVGSVLSAILSTVLIAVSAALTAEWFMYLLDPPIFFVQLKNVATIVGSLALVMVFFGLAALPLNCIAGFQCWTNIQRSRMIGRVMFSSGPPLTLRPNLRSVKTENHRTIEVVTRPANQINTLSHSVSVPRNHELTRNSSFNSAVRNPSQSSMWSYDF